MRITRTFAAVGVAAVLGLAGAGVASAATFDQVPPLPAGQQEDRGNAVVLSPYAGEVICHSFHGQTNGCWQQRPDGRWQSMAGYGPVSVYPVWDDPASLQSLLPQFPASF